MRIVWMATLAAGVALSGCATKPWAHGPWAAKPKAVATGPKCPAMTNEQWQPIVSDAVQKKFGADLKRRFGDTAAHSRIGWSKTDRGDTVITALRIGPASYQMPEPGKGGEVEVVFQACTGKLLKVRKTARLERRPKPL